jgi:hypothetical protein
MLQSRLMLIMYDGFDIKNCLHYLRASFSVHDCFE